MVIENHRVRIHLRSRNYGFGMQYGRVHALMSITLAGTETLTSPDRSCQGLVQCQAAQIARPLGIHRVRLKSVRLRPNSLFLNERRPTSEGNHLTNSDNEHALAQRMHSNTHNVPGGCAELYLVSPTRDGRTCRACIAAVRRVNRRNYALHQHADHRPR
jgi:hypothetical protein